MISELFVTVAREIQEFIGSQMWMDKLKETPSEEDFREWEALEIAKLLSAYIVLTESGNQATT
jgi:hypothetical protein